LTGTFIDLFSCRDGPAPIGAGSGRWNPAQEVAGFFLPWFAERLLGQRLPDDLTIGQEDRAAGQAHLGATYSGRFSWVLASAPASIWNENAAMKFL